MSSDSKKRILKFVFGCGTLLGFGAEFSSAQEKQTTEPVLRISKLPDVAVSTMPPPAAAAPINRAHALDPAIALAYRGLNHIRSNYHDYTATLIKRERISGRLSSEEKVFVKIRNSRDFGDKGQQPFSIYCRFEHPESVKGREVIWVEGQNNNKLVAHETGFKGIIRVNLDPRGGLAMKGNRYPICDAGIENLASKLIEKAERDRKHGDCTCEFFKSKVNGRSCTLVKVTHPEKKDPYDFHIAEVYIDDEYQIPTRYAAYSWPNKAGGDPILEEEYTYTNVKLNVGLTDLDFNPDNKEYAFP